MAALGHCTDIELHVLIRTVPDISRISPAFARWLDAILRWEGDRRRGLAYEFPVTTETAAGADRERRINGAAVLRANFAVGDFPNVLEVFDAIAEISSDKR